MPGYHCKHETHLLGDSHFHIRSLLDKMQYADPDEPQVGKLSNLQLHGKGLLVARMTSLIDSQIRVHLCVM